MKELKFDIVLMHQKWAKWAVDEMRILSLEFANEKLREKLVAYEVTIEVNKQDLLRLQKQIQLVTMQRDDNRALYNYTRYIIERTCLHDFS